MRLSQDTLHAVFITLGTVCATEAETASVHELIGWGKHMTHKNRRRRSRITAVAAVVAGSFLSHSAIAQQFTQNVGFGDSYVDTGIIVGLLGAPFTSYYPTGRFSGGTNFFDTTSTLLGISQVNYALGGARAGTLGINGFPNLGFATEVAGFIGSGGRFSATDLLTISIGGNDARNYYQSGGTLAGAGAAAAIAAGQATAGINALAGVGARTIVFTAGDVGQLPEAVLYGAQAASVGSAYSSAYNSLMQTSLASLAASGVRVEYIDQTLVLKAIVANQSATTIKFLTACPASCIGNPGLQSQYLFYFDGIHLTSAGFTILGEYVVNRLNAPLTFAAQAQTGLTITTGFVSTMFGRTDQFAAQAGSGGMTPSSGAMNLGMAGGHGHAGGAEARSGWQGYILAKGSSDSTDATTINPSYTTRSTGGTIGLEYRFGATGMIGTALDYTDATSKLSATAGKTEVDAYQFGLYGSWNPSNFFAQGLFSHGTQRYHNTRKGVLLGDLTSATDGTSTAAAGKIGYLVDVGRLKIGPIAGLTYASTTIDGYTENGDAALSLSLGKQKIEALVGSAGIQLRYPFVLGSQTLVPYLNVTAEEDFKGSGRSIQYSATSAPIIVNTWNIDGHSRVVYGRIAAGVSADVASNSSVNLHVTQTFGQHGTHGFSAVGGIVVKF